MSSKKRKKKKKLKKEYKEYQARLRELERSASPFLRITPADERPNEITIGMTEEL